MCRKPQILLASILLCLAAPAGAQNYPLLEELNRQTQSLYRDVQAGLVRVQLPVPRWVREAAETDDPMRKWDAIIDPAIRQKLDEHREAALKAPTTRMAARLAPTSQPAAAPQGWKVARGSAGELVLESRGDGAAIVIHAGGERPAPAGPVRNRPPLPGAFVPNNIGLLLDEKGHVLVPIYIEREAMADRHVPIMVGDAEGTATFVGSDEKTQITILKLDKPVGRPLRMSNFRPAEGSLVLLVNPNNGEARWTVWTGGERDYGVVVGMDGAVAGIIRFGQLLGGPACKPVIDQLIAVGSIRRAILGARLTEIRGEDPLRRRVAELGDRPAIRVDDVLPNSLAERAGLKEGDFILEIGNDPVGDLTTWAALSAKPGEMRLLILRDGLRRDLKLTLQPGQ